jgi:hypothetical protein
MPTPPSALPSVRKRSPLSFSSASSLASFGSAHVAPGLVHFASSGRRGSRGSRSAAAAAAAETEEAAAAARARDDAAAA